MRKAPSHTAAVLLAVFVTFLWSTSWVLIKFGLQNNLPPLSFAGLRYFIAFVCLIPVVLANPRERAILKNLNRADWRTLTIFGIVMIALAQSMQYISMDYLPAVTVSLLLNLNPIAVGFMSQIWYKERPTLMQWIGIVVSMAGMLIYFMPVNIPLAQAIGLLAAFAGILSNAYGTLLGRQTNQQSHLSPLVITFVSMGIGSALMLTAGWVTEGIGHPSPIDWGYIVWLAIVNTAFAFTLWYHTQRTLTAVESSLISSLMLPQIAILAFIFLGEAISFKEIIGLILVTLGVGVVQLRKSNGLRDAGLSTERTV